MSGIAYQNKDITSKIFAESLREKSLEVYGIYIPKIKRVLPTNLPIIEANENRMDNIFELDYSNSVKEWIMMTKVARLFEEEKMEAVKKAKEEVTEAVTEAVTGQLTKQMAIKLMNKGMQLETIAEITGLSVEEVKRSTLAYENI